MTLISCPPGCSHLQAGEAYQRGRRSEKALAFGREYLRERFSAFQDENDFHFVTSIERTIHVFQRSGSPLSDDAVIQALEQLPMHLGSIEVVVAAPNPLALALTKKIKEDKRLEDFVKRRPERPGVLVNILEEKVKKKAGSKGSGSLYLDFIATYFGAMISEKEVREEWEHLQGKTGEKKDPPGGIIIP
jgi:hypothetical protein